MLSPSESASKASSSLKYRTKRYRFVFLRRVRKTAKSDYKLRHISLSFCLTAWNNSAPTERSFKNFDIWLFLENMSRKFWIMGTLHEDQYTLLLSRSTLLTIRKVSDKSRRENRDALLCSITFFFKKIVPLMKNAEQILYSRASHRWQHRACASHTGFLRLKIRSQNIKSFLPCHCNNGCTNTPQCYVILHCLPCWTFATNIHAYNHMSNYDSMRTNEPRRTTKTLYLKCFKDLGVTSERSTHFLAVSGRNSRYNLLQL